jgi:hypothetical protein
VSEANSVKYALKIFLIELLFFGNFHFRCINASNGVEVWSILFWGVNMGYNQPNMAMADGIIVGLNSFDNQKYAFGISSICLRVTLYVIPKVL